MRTIFLLLCLLYSFLQTKAQQYMPVTDETLTVNSATSLSGHTRNTVEVDLPSHTIGYIYRMSVMPKGGNGSFESLFNVIKKIDPATAFTSSLMQYAIRNSENYAVDAFVFNNTSDANEFYNKNDNNWSACKSMPNRSNVCLATKECLNKTLYFGFRNNNISQGLDVRFELVAIVDTTITQEYAYTFTIDNGSTAQVRYFISLDNKNWKEEVLNPGYEATFSGIQREAYIKIYTTTAFFVHYKINAQNRYRIFWNLDSGKWDLKSF